MRRHLPHCAEKGKTVFGNLCALQRQASHFLSVLQASRHPATPPVASAAAPQDEHTAEEKTAKQMAERIIQIHKYGALTLMTVCQICTEVLFWVKLVTLDSGTCTYIWHACEAAASRREAACACIPAAMHDG